MRVTVVGGGITGLAAAWELARGGADVTVLEAGPRMGGRIVTETFRGRPVEVGPDAFLVRAPHSQALELCRELGLADDLVAPSTQGAAVWRGGRLHAMPTDTVLGVPSRLGPIARSGLLSPAGMARAGLDLALPRQHLGPDPSVGALVRSRFGDEVFERLVDPLVGGIHAGSSDRLSARAVAPQLVAAAAGHRSLLLGLRAQQRAARRRSASAPTPTFLSVRGGLARVVAALTDQLRAAGTRLVTDTRVPTLSSVTDDADAVIVTTPSSVAATLVRPGSPAAADELGSIAHASVVLTTLAYAASAFAAPPVGTGFLVPAAEGRLLTACSYGSSKWPDWSAGDELLLRVSAGRFGDERAMAMADGDLVDCLHGELSVVLGPRSSPLESRVTRWPDAFPQYEVGHLARVESIEAALVRDLPGVFLAGAAYRGVGIPACIAQGRTAARRALRRAC